MEVPANYNPWLNGDTSYLNGKFNGKGINVEINTSLSYIAVNDNLGTDLYFQGDEADEIIKEIAYYSTHCYPKITFHDNVIKYFFDRLY